MINTKLPACLHVLRGQDALWRIRYVVSSTPSLLSIGSSPRFRHRLSPIPLSETSTSCGPPSNTYCADPWQSEPRLASAFLLTQRP